MLTIVAQVRAHGARRTRTLVALGALALAGPAPAAQLSWDLLVPSSTFVQAGVGEDTDMLVAGATWDWSWRKSLAWGHATGYLEASLGRWSNDRGGTRSSAWVTQVGVTPVLRFHPNAWAPGGFVEAGIGANMVTPIYRNRDKRFSTAFNFGDHVAVGWQFGAERKHEIALRLQHFSNAGIKHPNPGENFLQLRYARRF
jgi:hypothetical protein